ncbi:hypothetical protein KCV03_g6, partial [Aureobasidium melanogenum]
MALAAFVDVLRQLVVTLFATVRNTVTRPSLMIAFVVALEISSDLSDHALLASGLQDEWQVQLEQVRRERLGWEGEQLARAQHRQLEREQGEQVELGQEQPARRDERLGPLGRAQRGQLERVRQRLVQQAAEQEQQRHRHQGPRHLEEVYRGDDEGHERKSVVPFPVGGSRPTVDNHMLSGSKEHRKRSRSEHRKGNYVVSVAQYARAKVDYTTTAGTALPTGMLGRLEKLLKIFVTRAITADSQRHLLIIAVGSVLSIKLNGLLLEISDNEVGTRSHPSWISRKAR